MLINDAFRIRPKLNEISLHRVR